MQVSPVLRRTTRGYSHWCPGCKEAHCIPFSWQFDGNLERPTFTPSVKITGKQTVRDAQGKWTGEWVRGPGGKAVDKCCHYFLTAGLLLFCADCTHILAGRTVPLPLLPDFLRD